MKKRRERKEGEETTFGEREEGGEGLGEEGEGREEGKSVSPNGLI